MMVYEVGILPVGPAGTDRLSAWVEQFSLTWVRDHKCEKGC